MADRVDRLAGIPANSGRQRHEIELIASENIVMPRGAGRGGRLGDDQQIWPNLSGQPLLRLGLVLIRLRRPRHWRSKSRQKTVLALTFANVASELLQPDEPGGIFGLAAAAGRHLHGLRPRPPASISPMGGAAGKYFLANGLNASIITCVRDDQLSIWICARRAER